MRKVEVCPYNENWPQMFREEAEKLNHIFGHELLDIYHIGSTSVLGLKAKLIIDIMPVVENIYHVDRYNKEMQAIGYSAKGENGIRGQRYFQKGGDNRSHHIHIFQIGHGEIERHLAFRDYLRTHPEAQISYGDLKERLAQEFPFDIDSYIIGKDSLIKEIEIKALRWYKANKEEL